MRIVTTTFLGLATLAAAGWLSVPLGAGGQGSGQGMAAPMAPHQTPMSSRAMGKGMMTKEQKIASAMSAAPASISAKATILDWPAKEGDPLAVLRAGNSWNWLPDMPEAQGSDPMCADQAWMKWFEAYTAHKAPQVPSVGVGYMIAPGGGWASNTDPYAMKAAAGNQWALHPPHLMILVPDLKSLEGMSTDPKNGGPYVMYAGTPYAHVMAPIAGSAMGPQAAK
jgi:hypothetical protein